jgi:hypothetical protein
MPVRVAVLPRTKEGYPIPWFVPLQPDGTRDLRFMGDVEWQSAVKDRRCWVCGQVLGKWLTFTIGPMCVINRITAEPPSHRDCAEYSAQVCPFLTKPAMVRRPRHELEAVLTQPAGVHSETNPGIAVTWTTTRFELFRVKPSDAPGAKPGWLIEIGPAAEVKWWRNGMPCSTDDADAALSSGYDQLLKVAEEQDAEEVDPGRAAADKMRGVFRTSAVAQLDAQMARARIWL